MSRQIIEKFYTAFQQKNWQTMQSCYDDRATFFDPVFQELTSKQVKAMWHMLLQANGSLEVTFEPGISSDAGGTCHWEAHYRFSRTGRDVHNVIDATFTFGNGKILAHVDRFDLWKWSGMALGWSGKLLGWTPLVRNEIRATAQKSLFRFIDEHPEYR